VSHGKVGWSLPWPNGLGGDIPRTVLNRSGRLEVAMPGKSEGEAVGLAAVAGGAAGDVAASPLQDAESLEAMASA
jgi:hypothetical protein